LEFYTLTTIAALAFFWQEKERLSFACKTLEIFQGGRKEACTCSLSKDKKKQAGKIPAC
jgi:hypothetical protein